MNIVDLAKKTIANMRGVSVDDLDVDTRAAETAIRVFLVNVFNCLGVKDFTDLMSNREYELSGYIENYIVNMYRYHPVPSKFDVEDAFAFPSELTKECLLVAKNFIENNFTEDLRKRIKKKVTKRKDEIVEKFRPMKIREHITQEIDDFVFFLHGRNLRFGDIDNFLLEVQHCYNSSSRSDGEYLTERDITLINFMSLPSILKDFEKQLKDEIAREVIKKFI